MFMPSSSSSFSSSSSSVVGADDPLALMGGFVSGGQHFHPHLHHNLLEEPTTTEEMMKGTAGNGLSGQFFGQFNPILTLLMGTRKSVVLSRGFGGMSSLALVPQPDHPPYYF